MKILLLYLLKTIGFFGICRKIVENRTLILAYHGFEIINETDFRDKLFIKKTTFLSRLDYLTKHCNVVPLSDYLLNPHLKNKVVITIDDGWDSIRTVAAPILQSYGLPYTVYLTTQNMVDNEPFFHMALDYILTNNTGSLLKFKFDNKIKIDEVITSNNKEALEFEISKLKFKKNDTDLLIQIANCLGFDFKKVLELKALTLIDPKGLLELHHKGVDIQLHTHTHNTPLDDYETYKYEIEENRQIIKDIIDLTPVHHCYPSGVYNRQCFDYLEQLGVKTATTCNPGFCDTSTNPYELPRFLDGENISQIVFEAEVSGVLELLRIVRAKFDPNH